PILLGDALPAEVRHDLLINLGGDLPPQWEQFQRLAEVVESQPELLAQARARFRSYRERGYRPESHNLGVEP
ncbi:MAG TPA: DNA polymerase III subunit chi, partial [Gammaproteobacteria bacterium]|nr:DNA polymerase III subunit chi [Gammaproteobacteria bacterium]